MILAIKLKILSHHYQESLFYKWLKNPTKSTMRILLCNKIEQATDTSETLGEPQGNSSAWKKCQSVRSIFYDSI